MICQKCGNAINDGVRFCPVCGSEIVNIQSQPAPQMYRNNDYQQNAPGYQQNVQGYQQNVQGYQQNAAGYQQNVQGYQQNVQGYQQGVQGYQQNAAGYQQGAQGYQQNVAGYQQNMAGYQNPSLEPKPKKKFPKALKIAVPVIAIFAVAGIAAAANADKIKNFVNKTFKSPTEYYRSVENESIEMLAQTYSNSYGKTIGLFNDTDNKSCTIGIGVEVSDSARPYLDLIKSATGYDASWFSNGKITANINSDAGLYSLSGKASVNNTDILSYETIYSTEDSMVYAAIPEVCGKYISTKQDMGFDVSGSLKAIDDIAGAMPDDNVINKIVARYGSIIVNNIDNVEKEDAVLETGGISQKCTAYSMGIDSETAKNIVKDVVEELYSDADIKDIFLNNYNSIMNIFASANIDGMSDAADIMAGMSGEDVYSQLLSALDEVKANIDSIDIGSLSMRMTVYIDGDGEIRGRTISSDAFNIDFRMPVDGDNYAVLMTMNDNYGGTSFTVSGTGTYSGDILSGEYSVSTNMEEVPELSFYIKDYDMSSAKDGYINGTVGYNIGSLLAANGVPGFDGAALEYTVSTSDNNCSVVFAGKLNKDAQEPLAAITIEVGTSEATAITKPSESEVVNIDNDGAINLLMSEIKFDAVINSLEAANVDSSIIEQLRNYSYILSSGMSY